MTNTKDLFPFTEESVSIKILSTNYFPVPMLRTECPMINKMWLQLANSSYCSKKDKSSWKQGRYNVVLNCRNDVCTRECKSALEEMKTVLGVGKDSQRR